MQRNKEKETMRLEIHLIQSFCPANLNRDENGMPKSTVFGGRPRARISSQCQKRAVRLYYQQYSDVSADQFACRSRLWLPNLKALLVQKEISEEKAELAAKLALKHLGAEEDPKKPGKTKTILFLGYTELEAIANVLVKNWGVVSPGLAGNNRELPKEIAKAIERALTDTGKPGDVALFGRMMASLPAVNVDAAVQVAHAISVNVLQQEFDFFTAVDDLSGSDDTGADHMGETGYNSSTYYRFAVLDKEQLIHNLGGTEHLGSIVKAFATAFVHAVPSGHQNGFAAHTRPALVMLVVRKGQPISLVDAFEDPVAPKAGLSLLENAVKALDTHWGELIKMYGESDVKYRGVVTLDRLSSRLSVLKTSQEGSVESLIQKALEALDVVGSGQEG